VLIPWSGFWDRNVFLEWSGSFGSLLTSNYARGAITGLGLINVWAALAELGETFSSRSQSDDPQSPIDPSSEFRNPQ
jgi:hypothetical protein